MDLPKIEICQKGNKEGLEVKARWPERKLPKSYELNNPNFQAWGYLVDYDKVGFGKSVELLVSERGKELMTSSNDFLLVVFDKTNNEVKIASSVSAKFPLFFAIEDGKMHLTPDFGSLFRSLKKVGLNEDGVRDYLLTEYVVSLTDDTFVKQIRRLPPGCVLTIKKDLSWKIEEEFKWVDYLAESDKAPMKPDEFTEAMIETLKRVIQKRLSVVSEISANCELSSGFDCDLVAYLLKKEGASFKGFSYYTSLNNHDTDIDLVKKFSEKHGIEVDCLDLTDLVFFSSDEELEWNVQNLFPGTHSLSMYLKMEKYRRQMLGGDFVTFTGNGGDEFYHSRDVVGEVDNGWKGLFELAGTNLEFGARNYLTKKVVEIMVDSNSWGLRKYYDNTIGGAAGHQTYFSMHWHFGEWSVDPFDDIEMIKLASRIPLDESGEPMHKQEIFKSRTDIFLPEQFRVKLPYHEQAVRYLDISSGKIDKILENSIFGKLGWIKVDDIREAIKEGRLR